MTDYPYVQSPDKLVDILKRIPSMGKPETFGTKKLQALGFTSSHDTKILNVLKFLGLIEDKKGGSPTEVWQALRSNFQATLADCIIKGYSELYSIYPDAHVQSTESLRNFFTANTTVGADTVGKISTTFQTLASLAEFDSREPSAKGDSSRPESGHAIGQHKEVLVTGATSPLSTININIQLQLPSDSTGEVYEKLFKSLKDHIWAPSDHSR